MMEETAGKGRLKHKQLDRCTATSAMQAVIAHIFGEKEEIHTEHILSI